MSAEKSLSTSAVWTGAVRAIAAARLRVGYSSADSRDTSHRRTSSRDLV